MSDHSTDKIIIGGDFQKVLYMKESHGDHILDSSYFLVRYYLNERGGIKCFIIKERI